MREALAKSRAPVDFVFIPSTRATFDQIRRISNRADVSPLRYPGGKRKLALLIAYTIATANRPVELLVEPFAGGAAVSIALLESGFAKSIAIADSDDLVAAFWKTVFSEEATQLSELVEDARITLDEWDRLSNSTPKSNLMKAFKCIFLNRTSFSGILNQRAGPIGGRAQSSQYLINCRFNAPRLAQRIRDLSAMKNRVRFVSCQGYEQTLKDVKRLVRAGLSSKHVFWYLDPPFFEKADRLYRRVFQMKDHVGLRRALDKLPGSFVLSYDDVPAAAQLYANDLRAMSTELGRTKVSMSYVAGTRDTHGQRELIVSDLLVAAGTKIAVHHRARGAKTRRLPKIR